VAIQTGNAYISDSMTDITEIPKANLGFSTTHTAKKLTRTIGTTTDIGNSNIVVLGADIAISGSRSLSQSFG